MMQDAGRSPATDKAPAADVNRRAFSARSRAAYLPKRSTDASVNGHNQPVIIEMKEKCQMAKWYEWIG